MDVPPNILILHVDQLRFDAIRSLGASHVPTPNIDRLVKRGCVYTKAYSSCPVCMPARHDLLTGASARHHGYWVNVESKPIQDYRLATLPRILTEAGYQTVAVGKMHFCPVREHHGWSHMHLMEEIPACREDDDYLQYLERVGLGNIASPHGVRPFFYHTPQVSPIPEDHHGTAWVARKTVEIIRRERDQPFFIMSGWIDPHPPYSVPEKYLEQFRDAALPPPCPRPEFDERQYPLESGAYIPDTQQLQRLREAYFAACSFVDVWVGAVLDALEETGQLDNTWIIFTSDHGEMLGDRGAYQKFSPYEGSAHVPLIISGPGLAPGSRCDIPASTWDVAATIADIAGVEFPEDHPWAGLSLLTPADSSKTICFHHGGDPDGFSVAMKRFVAAVCGKYKFIHYYNGGDEELYDLQNDPWEQKNLITGVLTPEQAAAKENLKQACVNFELQHGQLNRIQNGGFSDEPYTKPAFRIGQYFGLRFTQHPRWLTYHSKDDFELIIQEMKACLDQDGVFIPASDDWKKEAEASWNKAGGCPDLLQEFFNAIDEK